VISELTEQKIRVVAVPVGDGGLNSSGQAARVAEATQGVLTPTSDPAQVAEAITAGIGDLPVTVTPVVQSCDPGLSVTFAPVGPIETPGGRDVKYVENARVADSSQAGTILHSTVEFRLNKDETARPGYTQQVSVRVNEPRLPLVTVSGTFAEAAGPDGAVITYPVTAFDSAGQPLTPVCTPPPGSIFPVGVTTVTCTATDAVGNTGSATATMTVARSRAPASWTVWLAGVRRPTPDQVVFTDQIDLSARIGEPCANGVEGAPDWSPDGGSLAFQHGDGNAICVAGADGSNGRPVVRGPDVLSMYDPAFSPDGKLIAFTGYSGEDYPRIWAVAATGGTPVVLIDSPGGAGQPAFQRLPDLAVTATALPAAIPFGGRSRLEFVVTNRGLAVAPATELTISLPAGLRREEISTTKGACAAAELRCALGALATGDVVRVRVVVTGVLLGAQVVFVDSWGPLGRGRPTGQPRDRENHGSRTR
jgi:hypothetical protein